MDRKQLRAKLAEFSAAARTRQWESIRYCDVGGGGEVVESKLGIKGSCYDGTETCDI